MHCRLAVAPLFVAALLVLVGCAEKTPEEKVVEARSKYTVELNGCVDQTPEPAEPMDGDPPAGVFEGESEVDGGDTPAAEEDGAEEAESGEEMADVGDAEGDDMVAPAGPAPQLMCDIVVRYNDRDPLPGVTIDLVHMTPFEEVRNTFREYVETDGLLKGSPRQISLLLEVPGFQDGDGFTVEVRQPVPAAERSEYREFAGI